MLVQFTVGNYLSFKDKVTFSMVAGSIKEHQDTNVFTAKNKLQLLKGAAIYGANASGKSNLLKAMVFMQNFTLESSNGTYDDEKTGVETFRLSTETEKKPSYFEIVFIQNEVLFRYGFELDEERIHSEWFFTKSKTKEVKLFTRENNKFEIGNSFKEGRGLEGKTRINALFLSVVAQFNGEVSGNVIKWFRQLTIILSFLDIAFSLLASKMSLHLDDNQKETLRFLKNADISIENISMVQKNDNKKETEGFKVRFDDVSEIFLEHSKFDKKEKLNSTEKFNMERNESEGTKKLFTLSSILLRSIKYGGTLLIDELDTSLHPSITKYIVQLFLSIANKNNAQLIFTTHDTNLLTNELFRRDQIWFTEKDKYGATDLYSLIEFKGLRNDASFNKDYILGKYGAIPFIGNPEGLFEGADGKK